MMNRIATTIIAAILTCSAAAQDFSRHEFSINVGGGASSFQTQPTVGKNLWSWTGTAGLGYQFFFSQKWGIGTGANFAVYNGGISINNYNQQQAAINILTGNAFDFMVTSSNYKEPLQATMVTIPLMLQHQAKGDKAPYAAIGVKAGIPVSGKSKQQGNFTTSGYYPNLNVTYEDLPEYGFVTNQPFPDNKTNLSLKTAFMAAAEVGMRWRLNETTTLYSGVYIDYGLNDILDKEPANNTNLVVYQSNTPAQFAYNTAVNSYAKQIAPLAGGITLRLAFGSKRVSPSEPSTVTRIPVQQKEDYSSVQLAETKAPKQADEDRLAKEQEAQRLAEVETPKREEDRLTKEQEAQRLAEAEALRKAKEAAIHNLEDPIKNYILSQTEARAIQRNELDEKVAILELFPDIRFYINGHTCPIGTREVNQKIGMARAENAKLYLISKGVAESRILGIDTKRDTEPLVPNDTEANRRINRRVQLIVEK